MVIIGWYGVVGVVVVVLLLVMDVLNIILFLVSNVWVGFGVVFGLLVLFCLYKKDFIVKVVMVGMISGVVIVLFWIYVFVLVDGKMLSSVIYEIILGFVVSMLMFYVVSCFSENLLLNV